ncbi:MAG: hypothetical protein KatS3mg076_1755 [Candidatus Binatia bacterium]|nr:MAG: hypothetical protein KatS3mg076_1755 [Candidatus Binatia bacterium]
MPAELPENGTRLRQLEPPLSNPPGQLLEVPRFVDVEGLGQKANTKPEFFCFAEGLFEHVRPAHFDFRKEVTVVPQTHRAVTSVPCRHEHQVASVEAVERLAERLEPEVGRVRPEEQDPGGPSVEKLPNAAVHSLAERRARLLDTAEPRSDDPLEGAPGRVDGPDELPVRHRRETRAKVAEKRRVNETGRERAHRRGEAGFDASRLRIPGEHGHDPASAYGVRGSHEGEG